MNIYLESNFVLELALLQEQSASCEQILQEVLEELGGYNCKLFSRFDSGCQYILDRLG